MTCLDMVHNVHVGLPIRVNEGNTGIPNNSKQKKIVSSVSNYDKHLHNIAYILS